MSEKQIGDMNKNELIEYAVKTLGVELDGHKKVSELRAEVSALAALKGKPAVVTADDLEKPKAEITHLKHPGNGRVFLATKHLLSRGDMIPCDAKGRPVAVPQAAYDE